jgi:hypothetical protein
MGIALIILGVILYTMSIGVFEPYFSHQLALRCNNCSTGKRYRYGDRQAEPGDYHNALGLALLWPLMLPYFIANYRRNPRLQLADERIKQYWETKRIDERAEYIARLEAETRKEIQ